MTTSYKCPNCAANLVFDADQQVMSCAHCGAKITPEDNIETELNLYSQIMEEHNTPGIEFHAQSSKAIKGRRAFDRRYNKLVNATEDENTAGIELHEKSAKAIRARRAADRQNNNPANAAEDENTAGIGLHEKSANVLKENRFAMRNIRTREYAPFSESEAVQFVCGSCGASVITDINTTATFCAFCGSPTIITERLKDSRKPDYIIPFKYGRDKAVQSFFKWCHSGYMTPIDFVKKENIEKLTGLYVPFWLFSSVVDMDYSAMGTRIVTISRVDSVEKTKTITHKISRKGQIFWKMIPYDGASHIDDEQMKMIAPFDYKEIKNFDMAYLAGFFADRYDVPAEKLGQDLSREISSYVDQMFKRSIEDYTTVYSQKNNSKIHPIDVKYALLPVWVLNYKYQGKNYTFAMNGQTGKTAGEYPISLVKLFIILLALLPIAAVLVRLLIGGLVLGGIF